jgi:hypothetical protein
MDPPIPSPLDRIVPELVDDLRRTFGDDLVGAYLYGSAIEGDFLPALSDLDLVIVTARPTDDLPFDRFAGVVERLQAREPEWADRLDLTFVSRQALADVDAGGSGGRFVEISHLEALKPMAEAKDWSETWYLARHADRALVGPPPAEVFPEIPTQAFLSDVVRGLDGFIAKIRPESTAEQVAYRVITLCRLLRSLESRAICSKQEGLDWAAVRYPERTALIRAAGDVRTRTRDGFSTEERAAIPDLFAFLVAEARRAS